MSETMNIRFGPDMSTTSVEVLTPELETIHREALTGGQEIDVEVPSADSFIRLRLPSGRAVTLRHGGDLRYLVTRKSLLRSSDSPKGASTVRNVSELYRYNQSRSRAFTSRASFRSGSRGVAETSESTLDLPEMPGGFRVAWSPAVEGSVSEDGAELGFEPDFRFVPYELSVTGPRNFRVILPGNTEAAYLRSDATGKGHIVLSLRVSTASADADTVGGYLMHGDYFSAQTMAGWARRAEQMLQQKMTDPFAATVAAYLLLRLARYDLLHDWPRNLAERFDELPDGCLIWAATCALTKRDRDEALHYIRKGMERGLPVYTEGLYWASQILRRLGEDGREQIERLASHTQGVIWTSPFTALSSSEPAGDQPAVSLDVAYATSL